LKGIEAPIASEPRLCLSKLFSSIRCPKRKPAARRAMATSALSAIDVHLSNFAQNNASLATSPKRSDGAPHERGPNNSRSARRILCASNRRASKIRTSTLCGCAESSVAAERSVSGARRQSAGDAANAQFETRALGRELINAQPQPDRCKLNEGEIVCREFVIASRDPTTGRH
jgi:hypothetical protein